ncbi:HpcH/HpaI aldolase/citrate lyase family protein [Mesorhizobium sp. CC13]|uniref:HpcH/HpaI aldolase family protein n=1 Tax=Mesorhizobium sp. CC13 TaxID=3029194 RepID=UPI0032637767
MSLVEKLNAGQTVLTAWSSVPDALTVEILARQGFDAVTLDMQHGGHNEDSVLRSLAPVLGAGRHALVRVPVGRFDMASRALDFGAEAVIAPMVNSVEDAQRFAAATKYPPLGERSWGPTYAAPRHGSKDSVAWLHESNARTVSFAMVETHAAVAALDGILATPGIDGIFVGPGDFSIAWSKGETINGTLEDMMGTVADVARRTRAAGKHAGIYITDPAIAGRFVEMGFQLLATGSEQQLIAAGAAGLLADLRKSIG